MRCDLTDFEWGVIEPLLPMDRRGPKPKNNRQIINGMFYVLRAGSPWRDLPERYGNFTWPSCPSSCPCFATLSYGEITSCRNRI
jgi:transposase